MVELRERKLNFRIACIYYDDVRGCRIPLDGIGWGILVRDISGKVQTWGNLVKLQVCGIVENS